MNQKAFKAKQNGKPLSEYYGELIEIFNKLDHHDNVVMNTQRKLIQRLVVCNFFTGLNNELEHIRSEILLKDPIPKLE